MCVFSFDSILGRPERPILHLTAKRAERSPLSALAPHFIAEHLRATLEPASYAMDGDTDVRMAEPDPLPELEGAGSVGHVAGGMPVGNHSMDEDDIAASVTGA